MNELYFPIIVVALSAASAFLAVNLMVEFHARKHYQRLTDNAQKGWEEAIKGWSEALENNRKAQSRIRELERHLNPVDPKGTEWMDRINGVN